MKKWLVPIIFTILYSGMGTLLADDLQICTQGYSTFGKLTCASTPEANSLLDAYFLGASSLEEVQSRYPERFERIRQRCERKVHARFGENSETHFRVESITYCVLKRGYQEPCVTNADCIENVCHPVRGTCSAVFTVPLGMAQ